MQTLRPLRDVRFYRPTVLTLRTTDGERRLRCLSLDRLQLLGVIDRREADLLSQFRGVIQGHVTPEQWDQIEGDATTTTERFIEAAAKVLSHCLEGFDPQRVPRFDHLWFILYYAIAVY